MADKMYTPRNVLFVLKNLEKYHFLFVPKDFPVFQFDNLHKISCYSPNLNKREGLILLKQKK